MRQWRMVVVETPIFAKRVLQALNDDEYRALQAALIALPSAGPVIPGGGGLRKLRWVGSGRGKRDDLTALQLKQLRVVAESELE